MRDMLLIRDILLIGVTLGITIVALWRPFVGLLAFIIFGILGPHNETWGIARTLPLSQIIALGTIGGHLLSRERKWFPWSRESMLLAALWAIVTVSTLLAIEPVRAVEGWVRLSKILLMVFLSMAIVNSRERLLWFIRAIALSLGLYGLKAGIFAIGSGGDYMVWGPNGTFLEANNAIGLALVMNLSLLLYLSQVEERPWLRLTTKAMFALSYPAIVATFSRGAWLGLGVVTLMVSLRRRSRGATILIVLLAVLLIPLVASQRVTDRYGDLVGYEEERSAQSRLWNWEFCKRVALAHPLVGGGFDFYSERAYTQYYPEFLEEWRGKVWSCHSAWLSVLAEHGVAGFVTWVWLLLASLSTLRRIRRIATADVTIPKLATGVETAFVSFMVVSAFYDSQYFDLLYHLVAIVVVASRLVREGADTARGPARGGRGFQRGVAASLGGRGHETEEARGAE